MAMASFGRLISTGLRCLTRQRVFPSIGLLHEQNFAKSIRPICFFANKIPTNALQFRSPLVTRGQDGWSTCISRFPTAPFQIEQQRTLIKFSLRSGRRKTVKAVVKRFYRLDCGIWIRTRAGKKKHLWAKSPQRKARLRKHYFCNEQQSRLLNHMTTKFWKKRRHYFDDPYEPYHVRYGIYRGNNFD